MLRYELVMKGLRAASNLLAEFLAVNLQFGFFHYKLSGYFVRLWKKIRDIRAQHRL